jgi:hypothetical protein
MNAASSEATNSLHTPPLRERDLGEWPIELYGGHVGGLLPAFVILGTTSGVAATLALASQWVFAAQLATPTAK